VVSYLARDPFTPRGTRTRALIGALGGDWTVELHSSSSLHAAPPKRGSVRLARKAAARARKRVLLDNQEIWSRMHFRAWEPDVAAALLIGWPMSPLVYAAERLRARGVPYVVDLGDPWLLTNPDPNLRRPVSSRAKRAERRLWEAASGAVLTTAAQAESLSCLYPQLPLLIRPNGYDPVRPDALNGTRDRRRHAQDAIDLVYFGTLAAARLDLSVLLKRLVESGRWREVRLAHYGSDWGREVEDAPSGAIVTRHQPLPWDQAVAEAHKYDAAVALGYPNSLQMPSKAVQYLTLPIPRVAITLGVADDPLARYVAGKPGWLCCAIDDPQLAERLHDHVSRDWSAAELAPPPGEAWTSVADEVAAFVSRALCGQPDSHAASALAGVSR
jgi:hypothetical protein